MDESYFFSKVLSIRLGKAHLVNVFDGSRADAGVEEGSVGRGFTATNPTDVCKVIEYNTRTEGQLQGDSAMI